MAKEKKKVKNKRASRKTQMVRATGDIYKNGSRLVSLSMSTENLEFLEANKLYSRAYTVNAALNKLRELMSNDSTIILK